ncbi:DUF2752 domain-containing protein [Sphingobacterium alkalisoli]|uniref:DUF2752 domain-containing protein n=1 Tax=Sphingobacterium alkalisoli TaxID=1874115 RepID=A0A4U0H0M8_9SPHI|nr:DUF2752 domain-containing protein [Sphingobacterium alkalisoli]TJY64564.1 DUF2752 domain-containing protein [Sphingobacterium alkalisoli]
MASKRLYFFVLIFLGLVGLLLLYKYINPIEHALFPKCPVKHATGLDCPGCGGQRALHYLLNGQLSQAFAQNQLLFFLAPYIVTGFYLQLVPKPTSRELKLRKFLYGYRAIQILLVLIIAFTIIRNIV